MPVEEILFSAGGGFLLGAVAGYAIKKVMKIAAVVVGLFVAGLAYLSYKGWIDAKCKTMEIATRSTLANVTTQVTHPQQYVNDRVDDQISWHGAKSRVPVV
ncbi:MAG: FUN14 domain-containing protein [Candidatus Nitrosopolaris sp.]